jgi:hypothetical protein
VGRFRQQQLIRLVACLVAVDLAVGVVGLYARSDRGSTVVAAAHHPAAPSPTGASGPSGRTQSGGILAGGSFSKRRRSSGQPSGQPSGPPTAQRSAGTTGAPAPAIANLPSLATPSSARPPVTSSGGSSSAKPRGGTTGPAAGQPATAAMSGPTADSTAPAATAEPDQAPPADGGDRPSGVAPTSAPPTPTSGPAKGTTPSSTSGVWTVLDDATGDTVLDSTQAPQANPRADVVQSRGANTTKGIGLAVKVAQPVDPTKDPTWASDSTFVAWEVDTTGDGKPDFEIEYFVDGGKLVGGVNKVTAGGNQAACEAEAGFMNDNYLVGIDPGCLGSPASFSYRATVYYAADPGNPNGDSIADTSPDGGMSPAIRRTAA